ncbi:telomerase RNA component interacting RNase isoform 2-T2 [Vipera latastei]
MAGVPGGEGPASEAAGSGGVNVFANDGSFLELFKRRMEEAARSGGKSGSETTAAGAEKRKEIEPRPEPPGDQEPPGKKRSGSALSFLPGSYNGCSLLSLHPGGQAERGQQASPEDRNGSQETKDRGGGFDK